jgi:hypothetical protein
VGGDFLLLAASAQQIKIQDSIPEHARGSRFHLFFATSQHISILP